MSDAKHTLTSEDAHCIKQTLLSVAINFPGAGLTDVALQLIAAFTVVDEATPDLASTDRKST